MFSGAALVFFGLGPSVSWVQSLCYLGAVLVCLVLVLAFRGCSPCVSWGGPCGAGAVLVFFGGVPCV